MFASQTKISSKSFVVVVVSIGVFLDTLAYSIVIPFYPELVKQIGGQERDIGIILSMFSAGLILGSLVFGAISDTRKRRPLMIFGLLMLMGATGLQMLIRSYATLVIGRFFQGLASGNIWVLGLAMIADFHNQDDDMGSTMSWIFLSYTGGSLVGPLVGGLLWTISPYLPYLTIIGICLIDLILRLLIREQKEVAIDDPTNPQPSLISILKNLLQNRALNVVLADTAICGLIIGSLEVAFVLQLKTKYQTSVADIGISFLGLIIPQILASPFGGYLYDRVGFRMVVAPGLLVASFPVFALFFDLSLVMFLVLNGLFSFLAMVSLSPVLPQIMKVVDARYYGLAYGVFNCAFAIGLLIGPPFGSVLFQYAGYGIYNVAVGILLIVSSAVTYFGLTV